MASTPQAPRPPRVTLKNMPQGIQELRVDTAAPVEVDLVAVPGLGADPIGSWTASKDFNHYNWLKETDFKKSVRVLLYQFESAWTGRLQVEQYLVALADGLLNGLRGAREDDPRRPIVFIGHSLGGLIIAKAICQANAHRNLYLDLLQATIGCMFFGTPFRGTKTAVAAALYADLFANLNMAVPSQLLDIVKPVPENTELLELVDQFCRIAKGDESAPSITIECFYEEQETNFAQNMFGPSFRRLNRLVPSDVAKFVTRDSAALTGYAAYGLARPHRDLVRFDGPKCQRYASVVRPPLQAILNNAVKKAKKRFNGLQDLDPGLLKRILKAFDGGISPSGILATAAKVSGYQPERRSWVLGEDLYREWMSRDDRGSRPAESRQRGLWIRGPEGMGKTKTALSAVDQLEKACQAVKDLNKDPVILCFFFCDASPDCADAEELVKLLMHQIIDEQSSLAKYAKQFAKGDEQQNENAAAKTTAAKPSMDNMLQSLTDMLKDNTVDTIYFVIHGIHNLPEQDPSTVKLLKFIADDLSGEHASMGKRVCTRWLITSRDHDHLRTPLANAASMNMNNEEYKKKFRNEVREHIAERVRELRGIKSYNLALGYYVSDFISRKAENKAWVDHTFHQLGVLTPQQSNTFQVRRTLDAVPRHLQELYAQTWQTVLHQYQDHDTTERMKELLRAMVLAVSDPTDGDLAILADLHLEGLRSPEVCEFVASSGSMLRSNDVDGAVGSSITFDSGEAKKYLQSHANTLLEMPNDLAKTQHGILALRCFEHLKKRYKLQILADKRRKEQSGNEETPTSGPAVANDQGQQDEEEEVEESGETGRGEEPDEIKTAELVDDQDDLSDAASETMSNDSESDDEFPYDEEQLVSDYAARNWLEHMESANRDVVEEISGMWSFWKPKSQLRRRWLKHYNKLTQAFASLDRKNVNALHVAASLGTVELVSALLDSGRIDKAELNQHDSLMNTPLHLAASFGNKDIVRELLERGCDIDDGIADGIGEAWTPLTMAAHSGESEVMELLISKKAKINAVGENIGCALCAAILSGVPEAVDTMLAHNITLDMDHGYMRQPLELTASLPIDAILDKVLAACNQRLTGDSLKRVLGKAFVAAAGNGYTEHLRKLGYSHDQTFVQEAFNNAVAGDFTAIASDFMKRYQTLATGDAFVTIAATLTIEKGDLETRLARLKEVWDYPHDRVSREDVNRALYRAADNELNGVVKHLVDVYGASVDAEGPEYGNALTAAAADGNLDLVQYLVDANADVNAAAGWPLQIAAALGHNDIIKILLAHQADIGAKSANPMAPDGTALQEACHRGLDSTVQQLLEAGADPNLGAGKMTHPIIAATCANDEAVLERLLQADGIQINIQGGPDNSSPLGNAVEFLPAASISLLIERGAELNVANDDGETPLIVAARVGEYEGIRILMGHGADVTAVDKQGKTALEVARDKEHPLSMSYLVDSAAILLKEVRAMAAAGSADAQLILQRARDAEQAAHRHRLAEEEEARQRQVAEDEERAKAEQNDASTAPQNDAGVGFFEVDPAHERYSPPPDSPPVPRTLAPAEPEAPIATTSLTLIPDAPAPVYAADAAVTSAVQTISTTENEHVAAPIPDDQENESNTSAANVPRRWIQGARRGSRARKSLQVDTQGGLKEGAVDRPEPLHGLATDDASFADDAYASASREQVRPFETVSSDRHYPGMEPEDNGDSQRASQDDGVCEANEEGDEDVPSDDDDDEEDDDEEDGEGNGSNGRDSSLETSLDSQQQRGKLKGKLSGFWNRQKPMWTS